MFPVFLIFLLTLFNSSVYAAEKILINEFQVEPSQSIELINTDSTEVNISGWHLDDSGGSTFYTIPGNSMIYGNSCLVISTDFNLNKTSADTVRLFDNSGEPTSTNSRLVDSYSYKLSAGENISFQRIPDKSDSWSTASASLGLFNESKSNCIITPTPTQVPPTPLSSPSPSIDSTQIPSSIPSYNYIYITEAMVNPEAGGNEWVELYNDNDFSVSLNNWYVDDLENGGSTPRSFSLVIAAKNFGVVELSSSIFNNDADEVRLLDTEKHYKSGFEYLNSQQEKTWSRISLSSDTFCIQEPSKNRENNSCLNPTSAKVITTIVSPSVSPTVKQNLETTPLKKSSSATILIDSDVDNTSNEDNTATESGQILGVTSKSGKTNKALATSFIFLGIMFSLLTIVSVSLKMMKRQ